jgi:hypothetical protein
LPADDLFIRLLGGMNAREADLGHKGKGKTPIRFPISRQRT